MFCSDCPKCGNQPPNLLSKKNKEKEHPKKKAKVEKSKDAPSGQKDFRQTKINFTKAKSRWQSEDCGRKEARRSNLYFAINTYYH